MKSARQIRSAPTLNASPSRSFLSLQKTPTNQSCHLAGIATLFEEEKEGAEEEEEAGFAYPSGKYYGVECATALAEQ